MEASSPSARCPAAPEFVERIVDVDVGEEMQAAFLEYAVSVIHSRALPDARDGLKPVQRRILYSMSEMGLRPDRGHVKSSRVVGDVMGKYHPHGDSAIYDALVRMAQPFTMRLPLVDGHGNFGSLDDGPAASRYTEARPAPAALLMTAGLDEDTVDFVPNYDDQLTQPGVMPAAFPNLLVNGVSGIAVGFATNMPPHNLVEVIGAARHLLANPTCSLDDLMKFVPGPDLPLGGRIVGLDGIRDAYLTGRGLYTTRATVHLERIGPRLQGIVVTELPYLVGPEKVIEKIKDAVQFGRLQGISDVNDLTDRKHGLRLVIEINNGFNPEAVLEQLYKLTPMEDSFAIYNVALVDGQPRTLGLKDLLRVYVDFRTDVVRRRTEFRLGKRKDRLHLVEGLLIAILDIDEVIQVIRTSDDAAAAKARLIDVFDLSDAQATYILDLQLRRLTKFSRVELENEKAELERQIEELEAILGDEKLLLKTVSGELADVAKSHGTPRRTVLLETAVGHPLTSAALEGRDSPSSAPSPTSGEGDSSRRPELFGDIPSVGVSKPRRPQTAPTPMDVFGQHRGGALGRGASYPQEAGGHPVAPVQPVPTDPRALHVRGSAEQADEMWSAVRLAHPNGSLLGQRGALSRSGVFGEPGALYTHSVGGGQIVVVLARSLAAATYAIETTPDAVQLSRARALWVPGGEEGIRAASPILRAPRSALQAGRPMKVTGPSDWARVPHIAGIYRIHLLISAEPCVYVGRSRDLRARPFRHEKTIGRDWGMYPDGIRFIELIPVKGYKRLDVWTVTDLDEAEERHIARARDREMRGGPRVINITIGRNGPPSRAPSRVLVWTADVTIPSST